MTPAGLYCKVREVRPGVAHRTVIDAGKAVVADEIYDVPVVGFAFVTVRATLAKPQAGALPARSRIERKGGRGREWPSS